MSTELWMAIVGGITLIITWSFTLVSVLLWLNNRFAALQALINDRVAFDVYEARHNEIAARVSTLELWRAAKNGWMNYEKENRD